MGSLVPLPLKAGDLVLAAPTTLIAWRDGAATPHPRVLELVLCQHPAQHKAVSGPGDPQSLEDYLTFDSFRRDDDRYLINPEYYLANDIVEPPPAEMPAWFGELTPEQQAVASCNTPDFSIEAEIMSNCPKDDFPLKKADCFIIRGMRRS